MSDDASTFFGGFALTRSQSNKLKAKYTERVPVVVAVDTARLPPLDQRRFMVPRDVTLGGFIKVLRERMDGGLASCDALFVFIDNRVLALSVLMGDIHARHQDPVSGFLLCTVAAEATFG